MAGRRPFAHLLEALPGLPLRRTLVWVGWRLYHDAQIALAPALFSISRCPTTAMAVQFGWTQPCALCQNERIHWAGRPGGSSAFNTFNSNIARHILRVS